MTPEEAALAVEHVVGNPSLPNAVVEALLAKYQPPPRSDQTPRFRRAVLLRELAADPVSASSLQIIQLLASRPASAASPIAAAYIAVAAFLAASAPDFDAAATELFAYPDGRVFRAVDQGGLPALVSDQVVATVDQFAVAVGNSSAQTMLKRQWGDRATAEERVRDLLAAEWAAIEPSKLDAVAARIVGDGAVDTWRAADEATRAKLRILAGEEKSREILAKLGEPTSSVNLISTPPVEKVIDAPKTSCADLHGVVEDLLPAAKAVADEVLDARMDNRVNLNAEEVRAQPTTYGAAGPSTLNDKRKGPIRGKPQSLMDRNTTARTSQWEDSLDVEGSDSSLRRPQPSPRRIPLSPFPPPANKKCGKQNKWSLEEEEALRKGVYDCGVGNWKDILHNYADVFINRTAMNLKDKWRNMTK